MRFLAELKRRKVIRTAAIYLAISWGVLQVAELLLGILEVPAWGLKLVFVGLLVGFPVALVLSWMHRFTLHGLERELEAPPAVGAPRTQAASVPDAAALPAPGVSAAMSPPPAHSIAVLPFANMSEDASNEFFADGLSEELLNLLSRISGLRVIARTSSFAFKGRQVGAAAIARELNVAHLLEGSVRRSGNRIRIAAQLIRASDSTHVWSKSFDRDLGDIFAVQDEIAAAVVNELEIRILGATAPKSPTADPRAYALFLQGRHYFELYSSAGHEQALAALEESIAIDPAFAPAWASLGALYWSGANNGLVDYDDGARRARDASMKALAIDGTHAEAMSLLGILDVVAQRDIEGGIRRVERALELEPNNQRVLTRAGIIARRRGRLDDAIRHAERALRSDPLSPNAHASLGYCYYLAGRLEDAEVMRRKVLALSPGWLSGHYYLGRVLLARQDPEAALAEMQLESAPLWQLTGLAIVYHALGRHGESDAALAALKERNTIGISYQIAQVHAFRAEIDAAFEWLERALATHDSGLMDTASDPLLSNLHDDARWIAFLTHAGLTSARN
jgi:adenylate cyclase